jgi:hypothetical protein
MKLILFIIAAVLFFLDGIHVTHPNFSWTPLAFACLVVGLLII